jgi:hypothetical protein
MILWKENLYMLQDISLNWNFHGRTLHSHEEEFIVLMTSESM